MAKAWLLPCSLDFKADSGLPGGLPGGSKDVWSQERPEHGSALDAHSRSDAIVRHEHFLSPFFGLVHILSRNLCASLCWLQPLGSPGRKWQSWAWTQCSRLCGSDEGTKAQGGPPAQKWQFPVTPGRLIPEEGGPWLDSCYGWRKELIVASPACQALH